MRLLPLLLVIGCAPAAPAAPPLRDFRCVIHVHSKWSHDSQGRMEEILAAAKKLKIDAVCMTEHPQEPTRSLDEGWRGLHDGVLFLQGLELHQQILAIGITRRPAGDGRQALIDDIHAQGGVALICHPEEVEAWDFDRFDGMEVWNTHAAFKALLKKPEAAARILKRIKADPDHSFLELLHEPTENLAR